MIWLRLESNFAEDPRHARLSRRLGVPRDVAVARVITFACWVARYHEDGDLSEVESADLADGARFEGDAALFRTALIDAEWLATGPDGGLYFADWIVTQQPLLTSRERWQRHRLKKYQDRLDESESQTLGKRLSNESVSHNQPASQPASHQLAQLAQSGEAVGSAAGCKQPSSPTRAKKTKPPPPADGAYREWEPPDDLLERPGLKQAPGPQGTAKSESPAEKVQPPAIDLRGPIAKQRDQFRKMAEQASDSGDLVKAERYNGFAADAQAKLDALPALEAVQ